MTEPEISRRCRFCGAAVRERSFFCPQCGKSISESPQSHDPELSTETEEAVDTPKTISTEAAAAETMPLRPPTKTADRAFTDHEENGTGAPTSAAANTSAMYTQKVESKPQTRQARGGDVRKGFEKVREISTVMLDEASYDPSARLVLVAAVIFILFLIILIFSEMMR